MEQGSLFHPHKFFTAAMAALKSAQLASLIFIISFSKWICRNFTTPIQFVPEGRVTAVCNTIPINFLFTALSLCDKIKEKQNERNLCAPSDLKRMNKKFRSSVEMTNRDFRFPVRCGPVCLNKENTVMLLDGCHEGKHTPRLTEVKCPKCGQWVEVFVKMGGAPGQTGTLVSDERCVCGQLLPAGSYETDYES